MGGKSVAQSRRLQIFDRDGGRCLYCGQRHNFFQKTWSLHHRMQRKSGGKNWSWNLVVVCGIDNSEGCHKKIEDNREQSFEDGWLLRSAQQYDEPLKTYKGLLRLADGPHHVMIDPHFEVRK